MNKFLRRAWERIQTLRAQHDRVADAALLDSMRRLPWILLIITSLFALAGSLIWSNLDNGTRMNPLDRGWVVTLGWIDLGMVCWLLLFALVMYVTKMHKRVTRFGAAPLLLLAASVLLVTVAMSVLEQVGRSSISNYIVASVFVGTLLLLRPAYAAALFAGSYACLYFGLGLEQANADLLVSNRLHGFVATVLGLLVSILLWRKHTVMILLQQELQNSNQQLEFLSQRDAMTGLINRREFTNLANAELRRARRDRTETAFISVDVDFFKRVNDNHGHLAGDEVLKFVGARLLNGVRNTDTVARIGGEEFMLLLPNTSLAAALKVAEKLRSSLENSKVSVAQNRSLKVTASFGVTCLSRDGSGTLESMYAAADLALYAAKNRGRNQVESSPAVTVASNSPPASTVVLK